MADAVDRLAFTRDPRSDEFVMLQDTLSSLKRLALGIGLAAVSGLLLGMNMALFPGMGMTLIGIVTFVSIIPPLAILPILFITFGVDELAKVMLIFLGTFPLITRDIYGTVKAMPREQLTKALTLGADRPPAGHAPPDRHDQADARERVAVPDRGRGHRVDRRAGIPDLSRAALSRDGRDHSLRVVDYGTRGRLRRVVATIALASLRLGGAGTLMASVSVQHVWKEYGAHVVLENLHFDVADHEFITIVGASGCGKTTFLRMLLGVEQPSRGQILIDGQPLDGEPGPDRGIVFQRYSLFPHLSALENLLLGLELKRSRLMGRLFGARRRAARERAMGLLEQVGLSAARDKYPAQLSGGMQQRLSIAQSVICEPKILLLDEPFGALDPGITADMHALLIELWAANRMSIFMISHDIKESFELGTRLLTFDRRRVDPQSPERFGASVTYDLPLKRRPAPVVQVA
jgi:NitT/TauT family transport system ATP-binding protein